MAKIQERLNKVGNVLVHEYKPERFYCRQEGTVDTTILAADEQMQVGEVLILDTGVYREIAAADIVAIASATLNIVIDDTIEELQAKAADPTAVEDVALFYRGPAGVKRVGLGFGQVEGTTADEDAIIDNLEAAGIDVLNKYSKKTDSRLS